MNKQPVCPSKTLVVDDPIASKAALFGKDSMLMLAFDLVESARISIGNLPETRPVI
jgi:hypothetical protein